MNLSYPEPLLSQAPAKAERRWAASLAALIMLATTLPYLLGFAVQGEDWAFTGFVFGVEDGNSYIAKMLGGSTGAWLFRTPYTVTPQTGALIFLPYILLGKLASGPAIHMQLVVLYHLFRMVAGTLAILATYDFVALFIPELRLRRFATLLAVVGGGLGWLLLLFPSLNLGLPLEYYSPDSFGFLALYGIPHLALARAFLLWGLRAFLLAGATLPGSIPLWKSGLKVGFLWLITGLAQPLVGMVFGAAIGAYLAFLGIWGLWSSRRGVTVEWSCWRRLVGLALVAGLLPAPLIMYNVFAFRLDPFLRVWVAQSPLPSPPVILYLLAYGLLLPFAVRGAGRLLSKDPWIGALPVAWSLALPVLAYAPFNMQRRLPEGIWVALVVLAVVGSAGKVNVLLLAFPSTILLLSGGLLSAIRPAPPLFRPAAEVRAFNSLAKVAQPGDAVLSAYESGNALPSWAPVRVVIGHGPETAGLSELQPQVAAFFNPASSDGYRLKMIHRLGIRFVFWGPQERLLGGWQPGRASYLEEVYRGGEYSVFKVVE